MVFVEDAADPVASGYVEVGEVDDVLRQGTQRCGLARCPVGWVLVVEGLVLSEHAVQVARFHTRVRSSSSVRTVRCQRSWIEFITGAWPGHQW
jgi:hypothetical protein